MVIPMARLKTVTFKMSPALSAKVARLAKKRKTTQSDVIREALTAYAGEEAPSFSEAASAFRGAAKGPGDLSTTKRYLNRFGS